MPGSLALRNASRDECMSSSGTNSLRKAREAHLFERGRTLEPKGINKRE